jgi:hypothetical protein
MNNEPRRDPADPRSSAPRAGNRGGQGTRQAIDPAESAPVTARIVRPAAPGRSSNADAGVASHPPGYEEAPGYDEASEEPLGRLGRSKLAILATVFLAAGILGLPLIFYSPRFSRPEKAFWTVIVLLYTVLVFYLLYLALVWVAGRVAQFA